MKKLASKGLFLLFSASLVFSCASNDMVVAPEQALDSSTISATQRPVKNSASSNFININFAKEIASALDLNKDGMVDATEIPIHVGGGPKNTMDYRYNYDSKAFNSAPPTTPLAVGDIANYMSQGADLTLYNSKLAEKNKAKVASNVASVLVKDPSNEGGKVYGHATNITYFGGKTNVRIRLMDSALVAKRIVEQLTIGSGTVNGQPYQTPNGKLIVASSYTKIDKFKSRLHFTYFDYFDSGMQLFGSYSLKDVASKISREE